MDKIDVLAKIKKEGIVAVIRAENKEEGKKIVEAVQKGGIHLLEVTMTVPGALDIIKELQEVYKDDDTVCIGAGTVLDAETARLCIVNGAQFIVSPSFSKEVITMCNRYRIPVMSGAMTISEAVKGMECGVDIIKIFPGAAFGPSIIKDYKGPIPYGCFMPTGGVSLENIKDWIGNGAVAVGTGSSLTAGAKVGDFEKVTETAKQFVKAVQNAMAERA